MLWGRTGRRATHSCAVGSLPNTKGIGEDGRAKLNPNNANRDVMYVVKITLCAFVARNAALYAGIADTLFITASKGKAGRNKNPADKQPYTRIRTVYHTSCEAS